MADLCKYRFAFRQTQLLTVLNICPSNLYYLNFCIYILIPDHLRSHDQNGTTNVPVRSLLLPSGQCKYCVLLMRDEWFFMCQHIDAVVSLSASTSKQQHFKCNEADFETMQIRKLTAVHCYECTKRRCLTETYRQLNVY